MAEAEMPTPHRRMYRTCRTPQNDPNDLHAPSATNVDDPTTCGASDEPAFDGFGIAPAGDKIVALEKAPWVCGSARPAGTIRPERARGTGSSIPPDGRSAAGTDRFDELRFYADHFDTVEVNSTFYGQPRPDVTARGRRRRRAGFEFSLKLYQKFTHPQMFKEAAVKRAPGAEGSLLDLLAK